MTTKTYVDNAITVASAGDLNALTDARTGPSNIYIGDDVGDLNSGTNNTAVGQDSLQAISAANNNTAFGRATLENNTT